MLACVGVDVEKIVYFVSPSPGSVLVNSRSWNDVPQANIVCLILSTPRHIEGGTQLRSRKLLFPRLYINGIS